VTAIAQPYPEEILAIREGIANFIEAEVVPRHKANAELLENEHRTFTADGRYHPDVLRLMKEVRRASSKAGYYTMCVPEQLGGAGMGYTAWFAAWEQIATSCHGRYFLGEQTVAHWAFGPSPVLEHLTATTREQVLPALMAGEQTTCFGMSEPDCGSDALMMKTRAEPDGNGWRLNGSKIWTTNSPYADYCIVFAVTDPEAAAKRRGGISAFLVPTNSPGFAVQRVIRMWGHGGGNEAVLTFENVRIEPEQLVGELHKGFATAMLGVNLGRVYNSARAVALGRWAIGEALEYVKIRKTFGKPLADYQSVTFPLAEAAMQIHAAHLMARNACALLDAGLPARKELSMTKTFAVAAGQFALDRAMQAHGAIGFTNEMYFAQNFLRMRMLNVADGTHEVLRRTIVKEMLDGDTAL
jgi:alkylation response protein AidB-like acyl-CoA dehydrogenase